MRRALALFAASVAVYAVVVAWAAMALPDRVPSRFGASLQAERFGSRAEVIGLWAGLGLLVVALFGGTVLLALRGPLALLNIPHKAYWTAAPERGRVVRRMLAADVAHIGTATMALLTVLVVSTALAAAAVPVALPPLVVVTLVIYLGGILWWAVRLHRHRYRPPDGS